MASATDTIDIGPSSRRNERRTSSAPLTRRVSTRPSSSRGRAPLPSPTRWQGPSPSSTLWRSTSADVTCFSFGLDPNESVTHKSLTCSKCLLFLDKKCEGLMNNVAKLKRRDCSALYLCLRPWKLSKRDNPVALVHPRLSLPLVGAGQSPRFLPFPIGGFRRFVGLSAWTKVLAIGRHAALGFFCVQHLGLRILIREGRGSRPGYDRLSAADPRRTTRLRRW